MYFTVKGELSFSWERELLTEFLAFGDKLDFSYLVLSKNITLDVVKLLTKVPV